MKVLGTKVPRVVKVEYMRLANDLGVDESALLRAQILALLFKTGRLKKRQQQEEEQ